MGIFKFKRFSVCDDRAGMKVGTDAVLLGSWSPVEGARSILDIGSGSGVISLMMAQRSSEDARIDAIELLPDDAAQSIDNIAHSPWPKKVSVINTPVQLFSPATTYDLIVCNPPYFSGSLLPPGEIRSSVRHETTLTSAELVSAVSRLLSDSGRFCLILPTPESLSFVEKAKTKNLFLHHLTRFFTRSDKPQERSLMKFAFGSAPTQEDNLILYQTGDVWTDEYRRLTGDFYLDR